MPPADEERPASIADDIASAIASVESPATETPPVERPVVREKAPESPSLDPAAKAPSERPRGADGKFLPADAAKPDAATPETPSGADKPAEAPETAKPAESAPSDPPALARWSQADKELFRSSPKPAQDFLLRRHTEMEADYTRKTGEIAQFKQRYDPVDQLFAPHRQQMQQQGWTEASLIKAWSDVERDLMQGRGVDVVARIVRDYKIDPQALSRALGAAMPVQQSNGAAQPVDGPQLAPDAEAAVTRLLEARFGTALTPLQKQLQDLTNEAARRQQDADNARHQTALQQVTSFSEEKDSAGALAHPYFNDVAQTMVQLAQIERHQGRTPDLKMIYETAVWSNPSTRERMLAAQQAAQATKANDEARAKAAAARKAGSSTTGAPPSGQAPAGQRSSGPKSLREAILEAAEDTDAA